MKRSLTVLFCLTLILGLGACLADHAPAHAKITMETVRIAFIHSNDPSDQGFTFRQHTGLMVAAEKLGLRDDQVINYFNIPPGDRMDTAILEAIEWGANIIFGGTFAFGPHMMEAAQEHPDISFLHATGNLALKANLPNFHNFFARITQARYLGGITAGLRTETNVIGFVAAHPFAEVIAGYTAFYLGALSVNPEVKMLVGYINSFNDPAMEQQITQALVDHGADVIGQHANSPSTQIAAEAAGVWGVGYNNDMALFAPKATLVSPMFDWSVYIVHAIKTIVEGGTLEADYSGGLHDGMVTLSALNEALIAPGTVEAVEAARQRILGGWNIFTGPIYDIGGNLVLAQGEEFIEPQAAPSWNYVIQGVTILE
jgi:basic membrane protein A